MQVAGIDLAWGAKARTGIALTDESGALLRSASVTTDTEIAEFLAGATPVVIAIDAPIVVTNSAGMRECERDLSKDFRRFHAGTHPTNMSQPSMQPAPRAKGLVDEYGWSTDHEDSLSVHTPIALEVYPHSSMVGLFGLTRVLEYKAKSGRTPEMRQEQFIRLISLMVSHCDHSLRLTDNVRWEELTCAVENATRHSQLNVIEDEIDAIFCAYIAWTFTTARESLVTYGNTATGVIVTFPPPA
jgi:predicted RNase H-like nuclease